MLELSKEGNTDVINEHLSNDLVSGEISPLIDTLDRRTKETPIVPDSLSVDDLALLLVELTEGQTSGDLTVPLPSE